MPDAARARDSPGPNIRMLQKTIAGCRVSSRFFRRACTRASAGRSGGRSDGRRGARASGRWGGGRGPAVGAGAGDGPSGGRRPLRPGTARPGTAPTARTQQANRFFSTIFQYFVHIARFEPPANRFFSTNFSIFVEKSGFAPRFIKCLITGRRYWRPSKGQSGPQIASHSVPSKASARAGMRGPRRAEARGPRRAVPKAASDRRSKASRPLDRSACRLYSPDAELAGTKVMRW